LNFVVQGFELRALLGKCSVNWSTLLGLPFILWVIFLIKSHDLIFGLGQSGLQSSYLWPPT
jgi:hypothetical protein